MKNKYIRNKRHSVNQFFIILVFFLSAVNGASAQTLSTSESFSGSCEDCVPNSNWTIFEDTPDVSNRFRASIQGGSTVGAGSTWNAQPLPLPPSNHYYWITLRDVNSFSANRESISTDITGLTVGEAYEITMYAMTAQSTGYSPVYADSFSYKIGSLSEEVYNLPTSFRDQWGEVKIRFVANSSTMNFRLISSNDSSTTFATSRSVLFSIDQNAIKQLKDSDGDGLFDIDDLDDDNDGILDTNEGQCTQSHTDEWTLSGNPGNEATYNYGNGVTAIVSFDQNVPLSRGAFNNEDFWSENLAGVYSLQTVVNVGMRMTVKFVNDFGQPVEVEDPIFHVDRLGGRANGSQNSALLTLEGGLTWSRLRGTFDFGVTSTTAKDQGAGGGSGGSYSSESSYDNFNGTASGSLRINATVSTFSMLVNGANLPAGGRDGVEIIISACQHLDTDFDGIPDHEDTDSDNDGCPDALEGDDTSLTLSDLDSEKRLNSGVDPNTGVPTAVGNSGQTNVSSTDPFTTSDQCDDDGDGVVNGADKCKGFDDALDRDNDIVPDGCDEDDDNDGILDEKEGVCTNGQSGAWTQVSSTEISYDFGNGVVVHINHSAADKMNFSSSFPNQSFWSRDIGGDPAHNIQVFEGDIFTVSFKDNAGNPVVVSNPEFHIDRLGSTSSNAQKSAVLELQGGLTWTRLSGTDDFTVTPTTVRDGGAGLAIQGSHSTASTQDDASGAAAGSLRIVGDVSSFTINASIETGFFSSVGVNDVFSIILFSCQPTDTDGDTVPDYQDTDSDNDGCADAIEGAGTIIDGLSTLAGGSPTAESSSENLGTNSDAEGNPLLDGTEVIQDTTSAVTDDTDSTACTADLMLTKVVNQATPKVGGTIIYTLVVTNSGPLNATGVQVTDVLPTGITYSSDTPSTGTYSTSSNIWNIGDLDVGDSVNLQITATVNASGVIVNTAEITSSDQDDIDSTPGNNK